MPIHRIEASAITFGYAASTGRIEKIARITHASIGLRDARALAALTRRSTIEIALFEMTIHSTGFYEEQC